MEMVSERLRRPIVGVSWAMWPEEGAPPLPRRGPGGQGGFPGSKHTSLGLGHVGRTQGE